MENKIRNKPHHNRSRRHSNHRYRRYQKYANNKPTDEQLPVLPERPHFDSLPGEPRVIERSQHIISRKNIDYDALQVMYRLIKYGFRTFMVGGAVRDLLLGIIPKDIDIATEAKPEEIRKVFRNSRIIGRRFRLVHVFFKNNKTVEVSTFRQNAEIVAEVEENAQPKENVEQVEAENIVVDEQNDNTEQQAKPSKKPAVGEDNTFGNPQTDALRRDITINGLFYDVSNFSVIDYVGGVDDLENKIVRIIGEPEKRFVEDPVRMLRVVRHAARTKFKIEKETLKSIYENASRIALCPQARVFEEFLREMKHGSSVESFKLLMDTGLLPFLFPALYKAVSNDKILYKKLEYTLKQMSEMAKEGIDLNPSVLFAALAIGIMHGEPKAGMEDEGSAGKIGLFHVWAESPFKEYYERDGGKPAAASPKTDFGKFMNRIKSGYLRATTKEQFTAIGVSKKECDRMEQILTIRMMMFESCYGKIPAPAGLENRKGFKSAMYLLRLTARDKYAENCLKYWQEKLKES